MATNVYRGSDGTLSVAVESSPEGDLAAAVDEEYGLAPIGRVTGVTVRVTSEVKPFHELGQRFATELRPGNINVSGTIERAHVNGALLSLMLGPAARTRPQGTFASPAFNLSLQLENPALPGNRSTVTVMGVKLDEWTYGIPEDDFVMEKVGFQALWVKVEDATA
ncbi:hypothetical protein [Rhodospira trueperi]|jgi:hypothetical protein|uniref:Uncharacterized protein n=1 Tax=Rhodospira trueperi TaxID=69960 RepID=A0A1G6XUD9_9PROT|nr:hypothetical protein [Rhodospira trueperi]SDD81799.1 hypothetical protein SAMN05421720_101641 [Rhodospira trueperi]